jgi:hypothetical protein
MIDEPATHYQLDARQRRHEQFERHQIEYRLVGGWALGFHFGRVTRPHDDIEDRRQS